jgi:hypothetical protein
MVGFKLKRAEILIYSILIGTILGIVAALLLAQWTWLEMRFNTGLAIPLGFLVGTLLGWLKLKSPTSIWGLIPILLFLITTIGITRGNFAYIQMVVGTVVREGVFMDSLPISLVNSIVLGLLVLTFAIAIHFRYHKHVELRDKLR